MNSEQIANILAFYSYYHPNESVDQIALDFKLPASLIVNGLYSGKTAGLFTAQKKDSLWQEITVTAVPDDTADFGKDIERIKSVILETITNLATDKEDIEDGNLFLWVGAPLIISKVACQLLVNEGSLAKYWIRDLKDPKSKYYYHTLPENVEKKFASKNFKNQGKPKKGKKNEPLSRRKR
jgi:hypothetical protein